MLPPMLLYLRVGTPEKSGTGLWLPLFLVWLILLPIVVLVVAVTMLVDVVLFMIGRSYHRYTLLLFHGLGLLGATRGTIVSIRADKHAIDVELV
jgi:hypothetical protein